MIRMRYIPGYDERYMVSSEGEVFYKTPAGAWAKFSPYRGTTAGVTYLMVKLTKDGKRGSFRVHRLVALAFYGERPEGLEVRHLDGNSFNNAITNLKYGTHKENMEDRVALITNCKQGHEYTEENTYRAPGNPTARHCIKCMRAREKNRPPRDRRKNK